MGYYCLSKMLQGLDIQEAEHKMSHANLTELLQFVDNLWAAACHKMFIRTAYYFGRVLLDADRSQIGQLDFRRIPSYPVTMLLEN